METDFHARISIRSFSSDFLIEGKDSDPVQHALPLKKTY